MGCKASKSEAQRSLHAADGEAQPPEAPVGSGVAAGLLAAGPGYAELPGGAPLSPFRRVGLRQVVKEFWLIGFLSFGGTQANMAMLFQMLVKDLKWVSSDQYSELLGIVQALPGASAAQILLSAVTVATGSPMAGFVAFLLFCVPGAIGMAFLGTYLAGVDVMTYPSVQSATAGIGCAATVLVAKGAWDLGQKLVTDRLTKALWFLACVGCYAAASSPKVLSLVIVGGLVAGGMTATLCYDLKSDTKAGADTAEVGIGRGVGKFLVFVVCLALAALVLAPLLPLCPDWVKIAALYFKVGCLVFGGGPVVIPLLLLQLEAEGVVTSDQFGLGLAAIQAFPGPMFNLAAFTGALHDGWQGALVAWAAMMAPGVLLALGALPFWAELRGSPGVQRALRGVNACAAGLMGSAGLLLWQKLVTSPGHEVPGFLATYEVRVCLTVGLLGASELSALVKPYVLILLGVAAGLSAWAAPALWLPS